MSCWMDTQVKDEWPFPFNHSFKVEKLIDTAYAVESTFTLLCKFIAHQCFIDYLIFPRQPKFCLRMNKLDVNSGWTGTALYSTCQKLVEFLKNSGVARILVSGRP